MSQRVAVYGGSFDPFHTGHLVPTVRAQETFKFDAVHFVPAGHPPHKLGEPLTPITHRLAMVALATLPYDRFFASDDEVFARGPSYTVETVRRYRDRYPAAVLYFLLGSDSFSQIASWQRWQELVELAHLVVLHRAHIWGPELRARVPEELRSRLVEVEPFAEVPDPTRQTVYLLDHDPFPISATDVRQRLRRGLPIRELVPHEVNSYIEKYRLYRSDSDEENHARR
ncbi:MAG: nicotinate-nucleotide adenylyltransferase [Thermoanaerobaculales bacterium]|jgi:nicotinate-nucleotide adenylyltransferase|nr:nicotinate-nucleotide adenylyltransferase [Thermoanaerobaculales bacterium]